MIYQMMSILDTAIGNYSPPFCVRALGEAVRSFTEEVHNPTSRIGRAPKDFWLFHLGAYDDEKALFLPLDAPVRVIGATEVDRPA